MKKQYVAPEVEILIFEMQDIITQSLATGSGDNESEWPGTWPTYNGITTNYNGFTLGD